MNPNIEKIDKAVNNFLIVYSSFDEASEEEIDHLLDILGDWIDIIQKRKAELIAQKN